MPPEAVIEWGITLFIFGLLGLSCAQAAWPITPKGQPKEEAEQFPPATDEQAILEAMNSLQRCIDWRQGNTDSNLMLADRLGGLFRRAIREYRIIPMFNDRTGKWEAWKVRRNHYEPE